MDGPTLRPATAMAEASATETTTAPAPAAATPAAEPHLARLSREELEAQITELAGQLNAANYRWLMLIAEFDRRNAWSDGCLRSCAHWLNFKVGVNLGAAREKVRVAHALAGVPKIAAAMARGALSSSKVRALTRVATQATEDTLLMIALHGTAHHVETVVRHFRHVQEAAALSRDAQQQAGRSLQYWYDEDGSLVVKARLPALAGAVLVKALDAALEEVPATEMVVAVAEEHRLPYGARRADALALMAESYLQHGPTAARTADSHQVIIHVDAESLRDHSPGRCHVEDGPPLPVTTVRRLTCDASVVRISESADGEPLDVGRRTRTIPPAIRRALNARDTGCCFPGCTSRRYVDAHHVEHWADGGETKLSNLVTLCRTHHRLVHEGGIEVHARPGGGWRFSRPDGREFETPWRAPQTEYPWHALSDANAAQNIAIDAKTAATRWCGERMDYDLSILLLCAQAGVPDRSYPAIRADRPSLDPYTDHDGHPNLEPPARNVPAGTSRRARRTETVHVDDLDAIDADCRWWDGQSWREYDS